MIPSFRVQLLVLLVPHAHGPHLLPARAAPRNATTMKRLPVRIRNVAICNLAHVVSVSAALTEPFGWDDGRSGIASAAKCQLMK